MIFLQIIFILLLYVWRLLLFFSRGFSNQLNLRIFSLNFWLLFNGNLKWSLGRFLYLGYLLSFDGIIGNLCFLSFVLMNMNLFNQNIHTLNLNSTLIVLNCWFIHPHFRTTLHIINSSNGIKIPTLINIIIILIFLFLTLFLPHSFLNISLHLFLFIISLLFSLLLSLLFNLFYFID